MLSSSYWGGRRDIALAEPKSARFCGSYDKFENWNDLLQRKAVIGATASRCVLWSQKATDDIGADKLDPALHVKCWAGAILPASLLGTHSLHYDA